MRTEAAMVSTSSGLSERGSMNSALMPILASIGSARFTSTVAGAQATIVMSRPSCRTTALPSGTTYASSGTSGWSPAFTSG